ncbi:MAG TPA: protealysin inhibitor emfourin [Telluria sp.]|nr:protealysin inhibitor emfourin [Telluria sp.]
MHIQLFIDGGIVAAPGLAKPINLEDAALAQSEQSECKELVRAALANAASNAPSSRTPDARSYRIQIEDGNTTHSLAASDIAMPPAYSNLINFVRKHGTR